MKLPLLSLLTASLVVCSAKADEARLLRFPTTNGQDVVFSYGGDLYKAPLAGGDAQRLTSHVGYESFPRLSPDGQTIAFTAQYDGNTEVYVMPLAGGQPQRLTYTSTNHRDDMGDRMGPNNVVMTWSPDGQSIVYRNRISDSFDGKLWTISPRGGMSQQIPLPEGGFCSYSPDGKRLAYNRVFREFRTWKHYKGGMADDVWIYDPEAGTVEAITDSESQDIFPMWIGDEIYYCSDRDFTMNIFCYNTKTRQTQKVTTYEDYDVRFPSTDGKIIVYEHAGYIYKLDPKTRKSEQLHINLSAEGNLARPERMQVSGLTTAVSLSADGDRLAVTARGEVFTVPVAEGVTRNLTRTPGANERGAVMSPDGKQIVYISDRTGETELWLQQVAGGEPVQLTTDNDTYIRSVQWTPDGRSLLYTDRQNRLVLVNPATKAKEVLMTCPESEFRGVDVSADSKWIAYTRPASNQMSVVYVMNLQDRREIAITEKWYNAGSPLFSADGKYLIFRADRDFENPIYSSTEWNHAYRDLGSLYICMLAQDTPSPMMLADGEKPAAAPEAPAAKPASAKGGKAAPKADEQKAGQVRVDAEGIIYRVAKLPVKASGYGSSAVYCNDGKLYYNAAGGSKVLDLATGKSEDVADARLTDVLGKKALFVKGGSTVYVADLPKGKTTLSKPVDLSNMIADVDYHQEWAQIFDETWRAFRDGFYLENMHGIDWQAMRQKYEVLVPYVQNRIDLNYVIGGMIGELACGHAYINPGQYKGAEKVDMGLLGAELSRDAQTGLYRIDRILPGAPYRPELRSPLTEQGLNVNDGDYITAVDGISVTETTNIYSLLVGKAGVPTELTISSNASGTNTRSIVIKPINDEHMLYHHEWVERNLKYVHEKSGGKIGYVYIPDMGPEGLNEFARYFYSQLDCEALIIDDRANGGGNISPMVIERLMRDPYRMTMYRGRSTNGTIPDAAHHGPKALLINKYSASDGDLFPWSWKANNLGTVIGTRTWGGIVGISGSLPFMDGTDVRVPFFTNYSAKTGEWFVENHGVDPDILLDNDPIREQAGEDQQLDKAIEVLMEQLKDRTPLPKTPAPRTLKDLGW